MQFEHLLNCHCAANIRRLICVRRHPALKTGQFYCSSFTECRMQLVYMYYREDTGSYLHHRHSFIDMKQF